MRIYFIAVIVDRFKLLTTAELAPQCRIGVV